MSGRSFVDTNILLYAYDFEAGVKNKIAAEVLRELWRDDAGTLSTQVLQEFYVTITAKITKPISPAQARAILSRYRVWPVEENNADSVLRASEIQERYRLSFWDALIIAAAVNAGAKTLLSEDLNAGQVCEGVTIVNPLLRAG
jgi:predicted nucleic acid-binding protein